MKISPKYYLKKFITSFSRKLLSQIEQPAMNAFYKGNLAVRRIGESRDLYYACISAGVEFIRFNELNDKMYLRTKDGLYLITNHNFFVFIEIFCNKQYATYKDYVKDNYIIFDIGANRGYSSLFFAKDKNCERVFSFEPDKETFFFLQENLALNPEQEPKIVALNYGLYDKTEKLKFYQTQDRQDYVTTTSLEVVNNSWDEKSKSSLQTKELDVKQASEAIKSLISEYSYNTITKIIKIDIEGSEYEVLSELKKSGLLNSFSIIFGECHLGMKGIMDICQNDFELAYLEKEQTEASCIFLLVNKKSHSKIE